MTHGGKTLVWMLGGLVLCTGARAIDQSNADKPYGLIVDRNVFGLKPVPAIDPTAGAATNTPPPNLTLAGITTIFGNKRAIIKAAPTGPPKPGATPGGDSYILAEGQRDGDIEVVSIDEKAGSVKILLAGSPATIDFDKNGVKLPSAPMPVAMPVPGMPNPAGGMMPVPGAIPPPSATSSSPFGSKLPQRTLRLPGTSGGSAATTSGMGGGMAMAGGVSPGIAAGGVVMPGFGGTSASGGNTTPAAQPLSPEEQEIIIEAHRQRAKQQNDSMSSILPPTSLNPTANVTPRLDPNIDPAAQSGRRTPVAPQ